MLVNYNQLNFSNFNFPLSIQQPFNFNESITCFGQQALNFGITQEFLQEQVEASQKNSITEKISVKEIKAKTQTGLQESQSSFNKIFSGIYDNMKLQWEKFYYSDFFEAKEFHFHAKIKNLIQQEHYPSSDNPVWEDFFHIAIMHRDLKLLTLLCKVASPFINFLQFGQTPIHKAIIDGQFEMVEALIHAGADLNALNSAKENVFLVALEKYDLPIFRLLQKNGNLKSFINSQNREGDTLLHLSVMGGDKELILELMKQGADPKIANSDNQTPALSYKYFFPQDDDKILFGYDDFSEIAAYFKIFAHSFEFKGKLSIGKNEVMAESGSSPFFLESMRKLVGNFANQYSDLSDDEVSFLDGLFLRASHGLFLETRIDNDSSIFSDFQNGQSMIIKQNSKPCNYNLFAW
jgi:hypothetical protein